MCSVQPPSEFLKEPQTAAAEEILLEFEETTEERKSQRTDLLEQNTSENMISTDQQLCNQDRISSLKQENPDTLQIKEEQEEPKLEIKQIKEEQEPENLQIKVKKEEPELQQIKQEQEEPKLQIKQIKEDQEEPENLQIKVKKEEPELQQIKQEQEEPKLQIKQIKEDQEEPENLQIKVKKEEPELQQIKQEQEEPKLQIKQIKEDQEEPENLQIKVKKEEPELQQIKQEQEEPKLQFKQIKEEEEEHYIVQEKDHLFLKQESSGFMVTLGNEESQKPDPNIDTLHPHDSDNVQLIQSQSKEKSEDIKNVIVLYNEDGNDCQHRLLDVNMKPEPEWHRTDISLQHVCEEKISSDLQLRRQERNTRMDQKKPHPPQIKEEDNEHGTSGQREAVHLNQETDPSVMIASSRGAGPITQANVTAPGGHLLFFPFTALAALPAGGSS
ncbi:uncharacterized protein KZ484_020510 [Pholidichthys leucotaenia]